MILLKWRAGITTIIWDLMRCPCGCKSEARRRRRLKMNKFYGAAIVAAAACFGGTAVAADALRPYVPPVAYAPEVSSSPATFYLGIHGGYGWGEADHIPAGTGPGIFPNGY